MHTCAFRWFNCTGSSRLASFTKLQWSNMKSTSTNGHGTGTWTSTTKGKIHQNDIMGTMAEEERMKFLAKKETTFHYDDDLPKLPLPTLSHTLDNYLESVRPHVSKEQFRATEKIVKEFHSGIGLRLHEKLKQKADQERNWLERWWEDYAYLYQRSPLIPLSNMAGHYPTDHVWPAGSASVVERTSLSMHYYLQYWKVLRKEALIPQKYKEKPMSMYQWRRLYNCCRIPGEVKDSIVEHFCTEAEGPAPFKHIVVLHRGHFFTFDGLDSADEALTQPEIARNLQYILDFCKDKPDGSSVGALTCDERTSWYQNRQRLLALHPNNKRVIDTIESSLFAVVLDQQSPCTENEAHLATLAGDVKNRWADKSTMLIAFANGLLGSNGDHSAFDAMVSVSLNYYTYLSLLACSGMWKGTTEVRSLPVPEELVFVVDDVITKAIDNSVKNCELLAKNIEVQKPLFYAFGKEYITQKNRHPDTFVQLAIQLGYYRLHKRPAPTYETGSTRLFWHGRTETIRSCTTESVSWCKAMLEKGTTVQKRLQLLDAAFKKHAILIDEAMQNKGCDRHLLGLYLTALEEGIDTPELFTDPSFIKSGGGGNYILSTSLSGYTVLHGGVVPMCDDGYGVFYSLQPNSIRVVVSAWRSSQETNAAELHASIGQSLLDMQQLLTAAKL